MNSDKCGTKKIETHYCEKSGITFITEDVINGSHHSITVIGMYFGTPNFECVLNASYDENPIEWDE